MIRIAEDADIKKIADLYIHNWRETYRGLISDDYINGLTLDYAVAKWSEYIHSGDHMVLVAYEDGAFAGFAGCKPEREIENCLLLDSLHVFPCYRDRGLGSLLIQKCLEYANNKGFNCLSINIINGNDKAKQLYMKLGAKHHSFFDDHLSEGELAPSEKLIWELKNNEGHMICGFGSH